MQPLQTVSLLISPFFCEQSLHTFLLHMLHTPLWLEHAGSLHISHLMLWAAQWIEVQMWQSHR